MRLSELEPRWLINEPGRQLFVFRCPGPCCKERRRWLSCKNFRMKLSEQIDLFEAAGLEGSKVVVPMKADVCWKITRAESWDTLTVSPSIDASPSGDWHGHIKNGGIS